MDTRTAIITGAYGAIGKAIALGIAEAGYEVIMSGRNPGLLKQAADEVRKITGNNNIIEATSDLSLKENIVDFAQKVKSPVHILINNACTAPRQRTENKNGIEMQWAVNVMAYFHMMNDFFPHLSEANGSRIINVASYWAGGLDLKDPEFRIRRYNNDAAYRQSKQVDRMLTAHFSEKYQKYNITVNTCHPGDVKSKLSNSLGFGGSETPSQGADTPVWLALSAEVKGITGKYFEHLQPAYCSFMKNKDEVNRLFELCSKY